jgi:hypothetical protein
MKIQRVLKATIVILTLLTTSCELQETVNGELTKEALTSDPDLTLNIVSAPIARLRSVWTIWGAYKLEEASTDEWMWPTRGTDGYDGGQHRDLFYHTVSPQHINIRNAWNELTQALSTANTSLLIMGEEKAGENPTFTEYRPVTVFLKAYYQYFLYDLYRTFPVKKDPSDIYETTTFPRGEEAFNIIVNEVEASLSNMIERDDPNYQYGVPSRDAALMLLAKMFMNAEVYIGKPMYDKALEKLNEIIATGHYSLSDNYFGLFGVDNNLNFRKAGDEGIFIAQYDDNPQYGTQQTLPWVYLVFHYNQTFGNAPKWNGPCAPESYLRQTWFVDADTATDVRWKNTSTQSKIGFNLGFNYGQQYDFKTGDPLRERNNGPLLNFTFESPFEAAERNGTRALKYAPRIEKPNFEYNANDYLIWRYADALLMKAECLARIPNPDLAQAMQIINELRDKRKAKIVSATAKEEVLNQIYVERGRELYWEGHRRQDMIRFGTFLLPKSNVDYTAEDYCNIYPIPQTAIDGAKGALQQNPGY